jgi:hypothetical protein
MNRRLLVQRACPPAVPQFRSPLVARRPRRAGTVYRSPPRLGASQRNQGRLIGGRLTRPTVEFGAGSAVASYSPTDRGRTRESARPGRLALPSVTAYGKLSWAET